MGSHQLMQALENQLALSITQDNFQNSNLTLGDLSEQICADRSFTCKKVNPSNATEMDRLISGTYCHPSLIPHIACWVSPDFALKVSEIINFFIVQEWKAKLQASEESALQLLRSQQQSQQVLEEVQESAATTRLALEDQNRVLQGTIEDWQDVVNFKNDTIEVKQEAVDKLEDDVCSKIREHQIWASMHAFTMLKLNSDNSRRPYYAIRCQGRHMGCAIKKLRRKFPAAEVIYQQRKVPNAINLYSRLKNQRVVEHTRNFCTPTCTEKELLYLLNSLCGTQYPASNPAPLNTCVKLEVSSENCESFMTHY